MSNISKLHDRDFNLWLEEMAIAIKNRNYQAMDWDNLLEEIEDMGKSDKRALRSLVQRLIEHIFKIRYWEIERDRCLQGWKSEIINFRSLISNILEDSPSLKKYLSENYLKWYQQSVNKYQKNNLFVVPKHQPIELDIILKENFFG